MEEIIGNIQIGKKLIINSLKFIIQNLLIICECEF